MSCVIPIYNAEDYLDQGISSLLAQTYDNLEIVLVDDHSTDESWSICQKYVADYPNVHAYKTEQNSGGPLRGREKGIREANGEWITFMDCDDYVKAGYIENLVKTTEDGKYDIAVTGHSRLYPDDRVEDFVWEDYSQTSQQRLAAFYEHYFLDQNFWTDPADTVGQNLVRASVAKSTDLSKYSSKVWAEDTLMALAFLENSKNGVNFVDHHDFLWRQREGSGSHGGFLMTANRSEFYEACNDIFNRKKLFPTVSIIVPIYKVEKYLVECIDSLLTQTYSNLEIILVDDESPDKSGEIADEYAKKDSRITVIHKPKNEGLNMARATGFAGSTGEYVMFVDSDDMLVYDCVEKTLRLLLKYKADFVRFDKSHFSDSTESLGEIRQPEEIEESVDGKGNMLTVNLTRGTITVWGALYKRSVVEAVDWKQVNYRIYEDNFWSLSLLETASRGVYLSYIGYLYRSGEGTLSRRVTGNSFNGKPVGYLEFIVLLSNKLRDFNTRHQLDCEDAIQGAENWLWSHRLEQICRVSDWKPEKHDEEYVIFLLKWILRDKTLLEEDVRLQASRITELEGILTQRDIQLASYQGFKRSARLLAGNMKRRIKKDMGG